MKDYYIFYCSLLPEETIKDAEELFINSNCDSVIGVVQHTPFFWRKRNGEWKIIVGDPCKRKMRQEITEDEWVYEDGMLYIIEKTQFDKEKCKIGNNPFFYEIPYEIYLNCLYHKYL